ncbi:metal ABC transporter substrate-binding protein [Oceanivirga salmonicida]|uniref:metal ABC transporter substrate-binding protein n=1 Tax=Oceanivirga salmonicida TaxID=1769291 RepID=UPI00082F1F6A|nr:zinc ABC transporter substrate-binding protein [Oceanivirga salmonicida]
MKKFLIYILIILGNITFAKMKVGITMLPYYSYVSNIVGDKMEVVPLVPENINSHNYDPTPQDIKRIKSIDIVVLNGIGHDSYAEKMLAAANNSKIKRIYANENVSTMQVNGQRKGREVNPHTFISITQSIQQINQIAKKLGEIDPANRKYYSLNASKYSTKLRKKLAMAKRKVANVDTNNIKIATTHAGYDYLLGEFGLTVSVVIEPSSVHSPTAADLRYAIEKIKKENIKILFDEENSNHKNAQTIKNQTGVYVTSLNHLTNGKYSKEAFENFIQKNLDQVVNALLSSGTKK